MMNGTVYNTTDFHSNPNQSETKGGTADTDTILTFVLKHKLKVSSEEKNKEMGYFKS